MRTSDMIKSKFWRARDVEGAPPVVLTISDVTEELLGRGLHKDVKCFLWFQESPKGLQLNKTRVTILETAFGPDSEMWVGKRVKLSFDPTVEFGGRAVGGVKLTTPPGILYRPGADLQNAGWGDGAGTPAGRPPQPVWDEKRQIWVTPQPAPRAAPAASQAVPSRPPPPVWNETTQQWDFVDTATGEIAPPSNGGPPPTWRQQADAAYPPEGTHQRPANAAGDFDDDIPF